MNEKNAYFYATCVSFFLSPKNIFRQCKEGLYEDKK